MTRARRWEVTWRHVAGFALAGLSTVILTFLGHESAGMGLGLGILGAVASDMRGGPPPPMLPPASYPSLPAVH